MQGFSEDTELINKSIPNFRKLVLIFGGPMSQTRRRRCRRSSGNTTLRPHEHRSGSSSSYTAPPASRTSVNLDDDFMPSKPWPPRPDQRTGGSSSRTRPPAASSCVTWDNDDDFMPPNLGLQELIKEPEVCPVVTHHLQHHLVLTGMTTMMILCPQTLASKIGSENRRFVQVFKLLCSTTL